VSTETPEQPAARNPKTVTSNSAKRIERGAREGRKRRHSCVNAEHAEHAERRQASPRDAVDLDVAVRPSKEGEAFSRALRLALILSVEG
jgi:hypothetical protein